MRSYASGWLLLQAGTAAAAAAEAAPAANAAKQWQPEQELQPERFEDMFSQLLQWRDKYYDCVVPRTVS